MLDESTAKVRLLIAPAGYGKTTLAREWVGESERRDVWYRGGPASADVAALAASIAEVSSEIVPEAGKRMRERLRAAGPPDADVDILAELFAEDVSEWPPDAWLAFDDYQFAMESPASERFVELLTQQTPVQMLITSRRRPSWATARRILYGEILEIDRRALAMEAEEARAVLGRADPSGDELIARARGWPAVLGLASLTSERELPDRDLPEALYGYFAEELLQAVPPAVQIGLSQLAALPTLSRELAIKLLGQPAQATLTEGVRIGAITQTGPDFELHPLLSGFLIAKLKELSDSEVKRFADEAVRLLLTEQRWDEAFHVIASLRVTHFIEDLLSAALEDLLREGRTQTVMQWLDLADASHIVSPVIDLAASEIAFREGHYAKAEALALAAADRLEPQDLRAKALIRAGQSAMLDSRDEQALQSFRRARSVANAGYTRLETLVGECLASLELGLARETEDVFDELATLAAGNVETRTRKTLVQLVRAARLGGISAALQIGAEVRPLLDDVKDPLVVASFLNTYAHLLVLNARYEEALELGQIELEVAKQYRLDFVLPHALLICAASLSGMREFARAVEHVDAAEEQALHSRDVHIAIYVAALRARIAIHRQQFKEALTCTGGRWERPGSDPARAELLAYRGLAAACEGDPNEGQARCEEVHAIAGRGVEASALSACTKAIITLLGDRPRAAEASAEAFRTVETTGAFDCFVSAARASPQFIASVLESLDNPILVARVLNDSNDFRLARSCGLIQDGRRRGPTRQLTSRELEVAQLVKRGYTNRMIAEKLYISDSTVKVHVRHILDKLGARSRAELAARVATSELEQ
jgi:LuxR family transcriptional regulator, maltose regulon positive regulatory protein